MRRTTVVLIGLAIAASAFPSPAASSDTMRVPTYLSAGPGENEVAGSVSSPARACEPRRIVAAFKEKDGVVTKLGRDRTNRNGEWSVPAETGPGTYWATTPRRRVEVGANVLICSKDRSPKVQLLGSEEYR